MDVHFQGILRDPLDVAMPNHPIRVTSLHTDQTIKGATVTFMTDETGAYDFYLLKGYYSLEVMNAVGDAYLLTGNLLLNQTTPQNTTLEEGLLYSTRVVPEDVIVLTEPWITWWNSLVEASLTKTREHLVQINNCDSHSIDVHETWESDGCTESGVQRTNEIKAENARIQHQDRVYSDEFSVSGSVQESTTASVNKNTEVGTEITDTETLNTSTANLIDIDQVGTTVSRQEEATTASGSFTKLKELALAIKETLVLNFGSNTVRKTTELSNTSEESYESIIGSKSTTITHTNDGTTTEYEMVVDNFIVGKTSVSPVLTVNTSDSKVIVNGQLQIGALLDENGNPVDLTPPENGDTIFQVYQYSDSSLGPWEDVVQTYHYWRRENFSINGVVDPDTWSVPYQFRGFDGSDGNAGDTIYIEYQYSPDGVNWHPEPFVSGDKWRRERIVTNGVAGPWSDAGRIVGDDGETIETRSEYSIDGIYNWHTILDPADKWERRSVFINGVQDGPWSDPFPIGKGDEGDSGDTVSEEARYGPTSTIDANWTVWGGTQLDTHFWRQTRTKTVDGVTGVITYSNVSVVHRIVGKPGSGWYTINNGTGIFPSDAQATVDFINNFGRTPVLDDHLTYTNNSDPALVTNSEIKRCNSPEGSPVTWSTPAMVIQGDLIARGTISGDRLVANTITGNQISSSTTVIAGSGSWTAGMNGDDSVSAGIYQFWRFWAGATDPSLAPFRVDRDGNIWADNITLNGSGTFSGSITATSGSFTGDIFAETLTLSGAGAQIQSAVYTPGIAGWSINNDGTAEFNDVTVRGTGYFTDGIFDGTVYAENLEGGVTSTFIKAQNRFTSVVNSGTWLDISEVSILNTYTFDRYLSIEDALGGTIRIQVQSGASGGTNYEWRLYSPSLNKTYVTLSGTASFLSGTPPLRVTLSVAKLNIAIPANENPQDIILQWRSTSANNLTVYSNRTFEGDLDDNNLFLLLKDSTEMA